MVALSALRKPGLDADKLDGQDATAFALSARTISAGAGLTGGGDLSANRTLSLDLARENVWTGRQDAPALVSTIQIGGVSWFGDIDGAKWSTKLGGYFLSFMSDSADSYNLEGATISALSRVWKVKARIEHTGVVYAAGYRAGASEVWHAGNDGAGSGLDADLLDGLQASAFALSAHTHAIGDVTGLQAGLDAKTATSRTISAGAGLTGGGDLSANRTLSLDLARENVWTGRQDAPALVSTIQIGGVSWFGDIDGAKWSTKLGGYFLSFMSDSADSYNLEGATISALSRVWKVKARIEHTGVVYAAGYRAGASEVWHAGNDGAGSGLDADLLDGLQASAFALSAHTHAIGDVTGLQTALDGKQALPVDGKHARVASGSAANSGKISWGSGSPGTLAEGEIYLRHA